MSGLRISHDAWIMVGDGEKALILRNEGDEVYPNLKMVDVLHHDNPPTHEQVTDRPGRTHASVGPGSSALDETNWHRLEKHRFAKEIAKALYAAAHDGAFSQLIVVAPPVTLGDLRKEMHPEVVQKVVAEIAKSLTSLPPGDIERALTSKPH
ncbi:MAG: host attachment family protein [Alphaproteobacteria bacterium]